MTYNYRSEAAKKGARTRKVNEAKATAHSAVEALVALSPSAARELAMLVILRQVWEAEAIATEEVKRDPESTRWTTVFTRVSEARARLTESIEKAVANVRYRAALARDAKKAEPPK